ncbi:hypothetical protein GCM10007159_41170 [Modicisalibacter luteus]|nr:hypothetical protein GCM10007159_41170 [Halomonas lutea]
MAGRYEISDQGWASIEDIVSPGKPAGRGRPRRDDRQMLNGIFWILCSGAKWRDPNASARGKRSISVFDSGEMTAHSNVSCHAFT